MSKASEMGKVSAKGSFHVLWGLVVSTVISSVATIFVARLLGSDLYGLFGIALIAPTLIGVFRDWGINQAMIRDTAHYLAENRASEVRSILVSGLIFEVVLGIALSAISFGLSDYLASNVFNRPEIAPLIQIASITILAGGLINVATATFTGIEKMHLNSYMLILHAIIKNALMIGLVILGFATSGAILGYTAAMVAGGLIGIILVWTQYRNLPKLDGFGFEIKAYIKSMLSYGAPLSISVILSGFLAQYYAFLLPIFYVTDNTAIGNFGLASSFVVLIGFFATPINMMLFPAFSKLDAKKDNETMQNVYKFSVKYGALFVVPVAALVMCLAEPAVSTLFGQTYVSAPLFLALLSSTYLFPAFGSFSVSNFLSGQGKTTFILYLTLIAVAIGLPLGYALIMLFGVLGLIATSLITGIVTTIIPVVWVRKNYGLTVDLGSSAKIVLSSMFTAAVTFLLVSQLGFSSSIRLIIGVVFFALMFLAVTLLTKTINKSDIENLSSMATGLGIIGKILCRILSIYQKLI
jgi:O-antigen/teichoic acid export membrane protein